ncbi:MAG: transposase [Bacillota bacterium]
MYVLDERLFPFEVLVENYSEEDKIFQVISKVNPGQIDRYYCHIGCGRKPSDRKAIFRALVLKKLMGLVTVKSLHQCLSYSPLLAHWCGFDITQKLPSESTFSRFGTELAEIPELLELLGKIAEDLAAEILSITGSKGQIIIDSSDLPAHEKAVKGSDTGANFGHRTASTGESEIFYGYKIHLAAVNTDIGPIPVTARVAPANCSDVEIAPALMKESCKFHRNILGRNPLYYLMDAGYDAGYIYEQALHQEGQAITKLNLRGHENKSTEFTDNGTPYCPAGHPMVYFGTEKKKLLNKFRCPKSCGQEVNCQNECGCINSYGYTKRISIKNNPRLFCSPHRDTHNWNELYSQRSSIERLFSVLKTHLNMDKLTRRGINKAFVDVMFSLITFLAGTAVQIQYCKALKAA